VAPAAAAAEGYERGWACRIAASADTWLVAQVAHDV
jgi:hypothetical protein